MIGKWKIPSLLTAVICFLFISTGWAALTIYYKDGSNREVHKITFKGSVAELFLIDGSVITVPVEKLDLPSSGIGAAVGTYGTSKVTGQRTTSNKKGVLGSPVRQTRLREEWEGAEKTATVIRNIGSMQRGETVKIVGETTANSRPSADDYYDDTECWYDPQNRTLYFKAKDLDHAYVIVYKNQDGSFGKRLFDAVTFNSHFKLAEAPKITPTPMPEYPIIPDKKDPDVRETNPFSGPQVKPETSVQEQPPAAQQVEEIATSQEPASETPEPEEIGRSSRRRSWIAYLIFVSVVAALGMGAWFVINRSQKPFIDTSKFSRYEEDLKEFEIAIWLRNGKTADQLMEICLKKFYQDSPSVLTVCNKMLKGSQKGLMVPFIAKQAGRSVQEAEKIYDQIQNQIERIRNLIRDVSHKTGISPAKPPVEITQKTAPVEASRTGTAPKEPVPARPPLPRQAPAQAQQAIPPVAGNSTSSVALNASPDEKSSAVHLIEPEAPMRSASDLPQYANSVLNQIGFLSSSEDK